MAALSDKQIRFAQEYCVDFNGDAGGNTCGIRGKRGRRSGVQIASE